MDTTLLLFLLAALLIALGIAGLLLPGLPGMPLLVGGLIAAAWAEGFEKVGVGTLAALAVLGFLGTFIDFAAGSFGAKRFGASRAGMAGAATGALLGLFFGLPGILLGPFAGAVAGELLTRRSARAAGRAGVGATLGLALGLAAKLALGVSMLAVFAFDRFVWR